MDFYQAFKEFILGQQAVDLISYQRYGDHNNPLKNYWGEGVVFDNGYKYISSGGGCSGEDCNDKYIIDSSDNLVASQDF